MRMRNKMARNTEALLEGLLTSTDVPINGRQSLWSRLFSWLPSWKPTSEALLEEAEREVLKSVKLEHTDLFVPIARDAVVRTYVAEPSEPGTATDNAQQYPLVMIHGFGTGFLQFYKNLDHLHTGRQLLALDLPGFGRSTRVPFSSDATEIEEEMVGHLETWRRVVGLERFVLLGHSLGAFLATSYALRHPERVRHLILVDPWGLPPPPSEEEMKKKFPILAKTSWKMLGRMKPFDPIRMAGPWGSDVIQRMRPDLYRNFGELFMNYLYHCNVQRPTGEEAFYHMQHMYGWAKHPMMPRLGAGLGAGLDPQIPITLILGQRSWMKIVGDGRCLGETVSELRPHSYVEVHSVPGAGHHVHADQPELFCELVNNVCELADRGRDRGGRRVVAASEKRKGEERMPSRQKPS